MKWYHYTHVPRANTQDTEVAKEVDDLFADMTDPGKETDTMVETIRKRFLGIFEFNMDNAILLMHTQNPDRKKPAVEFCWNVAMFCLKMSIDVNFQDLNTLAIKEMVRMFHQEWKKETEKPFTELLSGFKNLIDINMEEKRKD